MFGSDRDADLVVALRDREASGAEQLVAAYGDRAYRLAMRITSSAQDAEEVAQDALWTVVRKIDLFRGDAAFGSWVYRIVANTAYQKLRARGARRPEVPLDDVGESVAVHDWSREIDDPLLQEELGRVLTAAMDALPVDYRVPIVLHDVEGLSNPEIADALGLSLPNVKSRVHRGRLLLRKRLNDYMLDRPAAVAA